MLYGNIGWCYLLCGDYAHETRLLGTISINSGDLNGAICIVAVWSDVSGGDVNHLAFGGGVVSDEHDDFSKRWVWIWICSLW